jgi:hypothetical protein
MKNIFVSAALLLILSTACMQDELVSSVGKKPVYMVENTFQEVESSAPQPFVIVGKIFKLNNKIYISDIGSGVHIIDNTTPSIPVKEAFISIYGNRDMAVKGSTMYADNSTDLIAIDISDIQDVSISKRIVDVYGDNNQLYPPSYSGYFECVDDSKGFVVDWIDAELENPDCQR